MKQNEGLDPIDVSLFGATAEMFASDDIAHLIEQFRFVLFASGDKVEGINPILFRLFVNSSRITSKICAFEDAIFGSTSR